LTDMTRHISRRVFASLLAVSGVSLAAGTFVWRSSLETLIGKIVAYRFPGIKIDEASIAALTRDIKAAPFVTFDRRLAIEAGARAAAIVGIQSLAQWKYIAYQYYQLERKVATFLVLGSNYLDVKDPQSDIITYRGVPDVCPNRFAEYDEY
jgi:hypothetical protein